MPRGGVHDDACAVVIAERALLAEAQEGWAGMKPGPYRTAAGSTVEVSGVHGGIHHILFDWFSEKGACIDCKPYLSDDGAELRWTCELHDGGSTALVAGAQEEMR